MKENEIISSDYLEQLKKTLDDFSASFVETNKLWLEKKQTWVSIDENTINEIFGPMKTIKNNFMQQVEKLEKQDRINLYEYVMNLYNDSAGTQKRSLAEIRAFFLNIL